MNILRMIAATLAWFAVGWVMLGYLALLALILDTFK